MSTRLALIFGGFALAGLLQLVLARWLAGRTRVLRAASGRAGGWVGARRASTVAGQRHDCRRVHDEDKTSRIGVPWSTYKDAITVLYDPTDPRAR
jgi:hypothetical protein